MQYNVAQLLKEPVGSSRDLEIESEGLDFNSIQTGPLRGKLKLIRTNNSILAQAKLKSSIKVECSRCLKEIQHPLAIKLEEEYLPTIDITSGQPLPEPQEGLAFTINKNHILNLTEAVRQYLLLALPMKPLCYAGCAGLCSACGHNLNEGPCDCPPILRDQRWTKLAQLASARGADNK